MNPLTVAFVLLLVLKVIVSLLLDWLNLKYVRSCSGEVPESFRDFMDKHAYGKSVEYTVARTRFGMVNELYDAVILAVVLLSGLLPWLYHVLTGVFGNGAWGQSLVLLLSGALLMLPSWPFDWWNTFKLEARFGFNRSTRKLWIFDKIKGSLVALILGLPILAALVFLFDSAGSLWWVLGFALFFFFQFLMLVVYPLFILPLFNKFEPLEEGRLKDRLFSMARRAGFNVRSILVMDGSKRSTHSNAFFAGFGRFRRIVLFDTLLEEMDEEETEAVLAHEIGHYKLGHITGTLIFSSLVVFGMFALLGWLSSSPWFVEAFGFTNLGEGQMIVPVFLLFMLFSGPVGFWLTPLSSCLSRRREYEADAFARGVMHSSKPLVRALRKLHQKNLSNLTPHSLYSAFYYSHPTFVERERALALNS